jgi:hypothetical protein
MSKELVVLFCAPLSDYPEQPKDISKFELVDCPHCKKPMWLSEKKKALVTLSKALDKDIIFACFICFTEIAKKNPELFANHTRVDI